MSKFKSALKAVTGFINDVVPNEIKPVVKIGLALIPGVGPALSAAYTAADAYGGGASLGNALGQGAKSFAISQVAGAASRSLGLTTGGNDLTDALGQTKGEGVLGLSGAGSSAASSLGLTGGSGVGQLGDTVSAAPITPVASKDLLSAADTNFLSKAASSAGSAAADAAPAASESLFSFNNIAKGAALAGGVASAASSVLNATAKAPTIPDYNSSASNDNTAQNLQNDAAAAADATAEEERRKRRGASSNVYTSPLGLGDGRSAAAQLLG